MSDVASLKVTIASSKASMVTTTQKQHAGRPLQRRRKERCRTSTLNQSWPLAEPISSASKWIIWIICDNNQVGHVLSSYNKFLSIVIAKRNRRADNQMAQSKQRQEPANVITQSTRLTCEWRCKVVTCILQKQTTVTSSKAMKSSVAKENVAVNAKVL